MRCIILVLLVLFVASNFFSLCRFDPNYVTERQKDHHFIAWKHQRHSLEPLEPRRKKIQEAHYPDNDDFHPLDVVWEKNNRDSLPESLSILFNFSKSLQCLQFRRRWGEPPFPEQMSL